MQATYSEFRGYGYMWSVRNIGGHYAFYAAGYGGQRIYVIPALDLVVVIAAQWSNEKHWVLPIVLECILPAVLE